MSRIQIIIVLSLPIAFLLLATIYAEELSKESDTFTVNSVKTVMITVGNAFVPVGYPENQYPHKELDTIWEDLPESTYSDNFKQPWKDVSLEKLSEVFGAIDRHYLILVPRFDKLYSDESECWRKKINCDSVLSKYELKRIYVTGASLFKWGCSGEVTPVLKLGKLDFDKPVGEWQAIALGANRKFPGTYFSPLRYEIKLPNKHINIYKNSNRRHMRVGKNNHYSLISYNNGFDGTIYTLINHSREKSDKSYVLNDNSPFDNRC